MTGNSGTGNDVSAGGALLLIAVIPVLVARFLYLALFILVFFGMIVALF